MDPALIVFIGIILVKSSSLEHDCVLGRVSLQITALYQNLLKSLPLAHRTRSSQQPKGKETCENALNGANRNAQNVQTAEQQQQLMKMMSQLSQQQLMQLCSNDMSKLPPQQQQLVRFLLQQCTSL